MGINNESITSLYFNSISVKLGSFFIIHTTQLYQTHIKIQLETKLSKQRFDDIIKNVFYKLTLII